jgi:molecular chaperone GrpE (heat shock protein)
MPYRSLAQVKLSSESSSPADTTTTPSPSPSPEPKTRIRKAKKRKSSMTDGEPSTSLCQSRKRGHNAIEKRYRTNLNDKISCLREGIPPLWRRSSTDSKSGNEGENSDNEATDKKTGQQKYGKADILTRALEYIQHLESTSARLGDEVGVLKKRVEAFEMLAMSGSIIVSKGAPAPNGLLTPKTETLESIQEGASPPFGL